MSGINSMEGTVNLNVRKNELISSLQAGMVFCACLLLTFLFPLIASSAHSFLPSALVNILFFFPQVAFPYDSFYAKDTSKQIFSRSLAGFLNVFQWLLITLGFAWLARSVKFIYLVPMAIGTICLVSIAVKFAFSLFGINLMLDGP